MPEFDLRKSVQEFANQLRQDIKDIAGSTTASWDEEEKIAGKEKVHQKHGDSGNYSQYQHASYHAKYLFDARRMKMRLGRTAVIAGAAVYAWTFLANPILLLGLGAALFDLFIGFGTVTAWTKETLSQTRTKRTGPNKIGRAHV